MNKYKIDIWLSFGKIAFAVGVIVVLLSYLYSNIHGYISGFKWMGFGSFFIFFVSILKLSFDSIKTGRQLTLTDVISKVLVFSVILVPILITINLLNKSSNKLVKLEKVEKIPFMLNLSITLVYVFITIQALLLSQSNELDGDPNKEKLSHALILFFSIFVFFSLGEIYLIVNYYLTDG